MVDKVLARSELSAHGPDEIWQGPDKIQPRSDKALTGVDKVLGWSEFAGPGKVRQGPDRGGEGPGTV